LDPQDERASRLGLLVDRVERRLVERTGVTARERQRQGRHCVFVDTVAKPYAECRCVVSGSFEDLGERSVGLERVGGEEQGDVPGTVIGDEGEVRLDVGVGTALAPDTDIGSCRVEPNLWAAGDYNPRKLGLVGVRERVSDRTRVSKTGCGCLELFVLVEKHGDSTVGRADTEDGRGGRVMLDVETELLDKLAAVRVEQRPCLVARVIPIAALRDAFPEFMRCQHAVVTDPW
jgi:hypothetical protein